MKKSFQWLTGHDNQSKGLWPIEWLAIIYSILTTLTMFVLWPDMNHPWDMLADRLYIFLGTILLWRIYLLWPRRLMTFIRITAQMALLSYWYPDTYEFNRTFPNLDHIFARWDAVLFGCQPSLEFSRLCPWPWFSEAVNMGYFSYYPMIVAVMVFFFLCRNDRYEKASFTVMCSFFIFYLVYIFLPVAGPQFYFQAVSPESVENGIFPSLGTYFNHRTDMLPSPGYADGFFCHLVEWAQDSFLAYRDYFYPSLSDPSAKQTFLLHIIAFRLPFDTGHSLYSGTLLSGCHCRDISLLSSFLPEQMDIFPFDRSPKESPVFSNMNVRRETAEINNEKNSPPQTHVTGKSVEFHHLP